jgi:hypothetical protein
MTIYAVTNWGAHMDNHNKVPSVISYTDPPSDEEQQWGSSLSEDAICMIHTKLELDVESVSEELDLILSSLEGMKNFNFQHIQENKGSADYPDKSSEEIVTDYLTKVFEYVLDTVEHFTEEFLARVPTDIVMTVPTVSISTFDIGAVDVTDIFRQGLVIQSQKLDV